MNCQDCERRFICLTNKVDILKEAKNKLQTLRGRRIARVLTDKDLLSAIEEAERDGYAVRAGDVVANTYRYPASRMRLAVVKRCEQSVAIWADWGSAKKGASSLPASLPRQYRKSDKEFGSTLQKFAMENKPDFLLMIEDVKKEGRK